MGRRMEGVEEEGEQVPAPLDSTHDPALGLVELSGFSNVGSIVSSS